MIPCSLLTVLSFSFKVWHTWWWATKVWALFLLPAIPPLSHSLPSCFTNVCACASGAVLRLEAAQIWAVIALTLNDPVDSHSPSDLFSPLMTSFSNSFSSLPTPLTVIPLHLFLLFNYSHSNVLPGCGSSRGTFALKLLGCDAWWWEIKACWIRELILIRPRFCNACCECLHRQFVLLSFVWLLHILIALQSGDAKCCSSRSTLLCPSLHRLSYICSHQASLSCQSILFRLAHGTYWCLLSFCSPFFCLDSAFFMEHFIKSHR